MRSLFDTVPHNNTPTSKAAASAQFAGSKAANDRARILAHLRERGGMGATNDEIAEHLSIKLATV
ncbi:MAG: hypothetical protein KDB07_13845, partial [Planctomycetes bacterium]|nr:hypothetical protein [Planctomycetota bacterium]